MIHLGEKSGVLKNLYIKKLILNYKTKLFVNLYMFLGI